VFLDVIRVRQLQESLKVAPRGRAAGNDLVNARVGGRRRVPRSADLLNESGGAARI